MSHIAIVKVDGRIIYFVGRDVEHVGVRDIDMWVKSKANVRVVFDEHHECLSTLPPLDFFYQGVVLPNGIYAGIIRHEIGVDAVRPGVPATWRISRYLPNGTTLALFEEPNGTLVWEGLSHLTFRHSDLILKLFPSPVEALAFLVGFDDIPYFYHSPPEK